MSHLAVVVQIIKPAWEPTGYMEEDGLEKYGHKYQSCHVWHRIYTPAQLYQWE